MSAFTFWLDKGGHIARGTADTSSRSAEAWRLTACPVRPLDECGVVIQWPTGERWTHEHIAGAFDTPNDEQEAA